MEKEQPKNKVINRNEVIKGTIISIVLLSIFVIGVSIGKTQSLIWAIQFVVQICIASLWWIIKTGLFSSLSMGYKKIGTSVINAKHNKLGAYKHVDKKNISKTNKKIKSSKNINNLSGIFLMYLIGLCEFIIYIIATYAY